MTRGQCYKTFYGRNLRVFVISYSVRPWQTFKPSLIFVGEARSSLLDWATLKVLHSGRLQPYQQKLD
jgi:hypothetical protein